MSPQPHLLYVFNLSFLHFDKKCLRNNVVRRNHKNNALKSKLHKFKFRTLKNDSYFPNPLINHLCNLKNSDWLNTYIETSSVRVWVEFGSGPVRVKLGLSLGQVQSLISRNGTLVYLCSANEWTESTLGTCIVIPNSLQ